MSDRCDSEVFEKGEPILLIDGWAKDVEPWVQKVAALSGQRVDWHYSGGIAQVLFLGDRLRVMGAVEALERELVWNDSDEPRFKGSERRNPRIMRRFGEAAPGIYRAGVTEAPEGAVACVTTSGENEWIGSGPVQSEGQRDDA
jgi:hypothetical protein